MVARLQGIVGPGMMRDVAPVNMELMATPARTMVEGVVPLTLEIPRIASVVAKPEAKAQIDTKYGLVMAKAEIVPPPLVWMPAPRTTMAKAAPKEAPWETPRVEAEASGLRRTHCMETPARARAMPTTIAVTVRGIRTVQTIMLALFVPFRKIAFRRSSWLMLEEPTERER